MVKLVILFRRELDTPNFDLRYTRNLALLKSMPGVVGVYEGLVLGGPAGETTYHRMLEIAFDDFEALDAALTSPQGVTAGKDLMDFAGTQAELLFVEVADDVTVQTLSPENLQAFLDHHAIEAEIVFPGAPTPTVPAAAQAVGVEVDQIVKSVIFLVNGKPFLVYGCGLRQVDPRKLAERLNVSRKDVKLANPDELLDITGYAKGTVPPVGLKSEMPAFMDPAVRGHDVVYAGGGGIDALLKIDSAELLRVSRAEITPMLRDIDKAETGKDET